MESGCSDDGIGKFEGILTAKRSTPVNNNLCKWIFIEVLDKELSCILH